MECPVQGCGKNVGGVSLVVGVVKITTFSCSCGRVWRTRALLLPSVGVKVLVGEVERLSAKYPGMKPPHIKIALEFLAAKVSEVEHASMDAARALKKRREDLWERQFLKSALGEDL